MGLELAPNLSLTSVCQHVRTLRPYLVGNEFKDEDDWIDQITMVWTELRGWEKETKKMEGAVDQF